MFAAMSDGRGVVLILQMDSIDLSSLDEAQEESHEFEVDLRCVVVAKISNQLRAEFLR
jgi:hypothetical protein